MSRQNSRDVSSLEVTLNGSQIGIEPVGNATKTLEDVKVMLVQGQKGDKGDTPSQMAHSITVCDPNGNEFEYDGSVDINVFKRNVLVTIPSSGWSASADSDGYYTNTVNLGMPFNTYSPIFVSPIGSDMGTPATSAQNSAFRQCDMFYLADGTSVSSMTAKAKTKPTIDFNVKVSGEYYA